MPRRSIISHLGNLVRAFRESQRITQHELANATNPSTNQSVVSHLETGMRLPPAPILRGICTYLNIPEALWASFAVPGLRRWANSTSPFLDPPPGPQVIAVSGIMGSGKTTLARNLAVAFNYQFVGESRRARQYLPDLQRDPSKWAFETQLAFFTNKAFALMEVIDKQLGAVIDRSLQEDVEVFAKYYFETDAMDERAYSVYSALSNYFLEELPLPEIIIFCECSKQTARRRIKNRNRLDAGLHLLDQLEKISDYYSDWLNRCHARTIVRIDSERWDWRKQDIFFQIVREIETLYESVEVNPVQPDLFLSTSGSSNSPRTREVPKQQILKIERHEKPSTDYFGTNIDYSPLPYPSAYLAAPFTAVASPQSKLPSDLFPDPHAHGTIPMGGLRQTLLDLERVLLQVGINCLIPHRDVNNWGNSSLLPSDVVRLCTTHVSRCDLFVGILAQSHGSHYELGIARGLSKPSIVVHCDVLDESFIASGFKGKSNDLLPVYCRHLSDIPKRFLDSDVRDFLNRFV